jgi:hypothetical protein
MTGAFANVRLELPHTEVAINVPASAVVFDQSGLRVAFAITSDATEVTADSWPFTTARPAQH